MTGPVDSVKAKLNEQCLTRSLSKDGCNLGLRGLPRNRIVIDLDNPFAPVDTTATRCDYVFLTSGDRTEALAAAIELKRGGFTASRVATQIQTGADLLAKLLSEHTHVPFHPLVVSGKFPKGERRGFRRASVRFRGVDHHLVHATCGSQLLAALG